MRMRTLVAVLSALAMVLAACGTSGDGADTTAQATDDPTTTAAAPEEPATTEPSDDDGDDGGETWKHLEGLRNHPSRPHWNEGGAGLILHVIVVDPEDGDRI